MKTFWKVLIPAVLSAIIASPSARAQKSVDVQSLESFVAASQQARIETGHLNGSHVRVYQHGKEVLDRCYGTKGIGQAALAGDELYRIASMTKPVTGLALLIEQERGHLNIYDDVADYLPEFSQMRLKDGTLAENKIKIYQLVSHSSGIGDATIDESVTAAFNLDSAVAQYSRLPLNYDPGTATAYSTGAFDVAARIIEKVSGMEYGEYLKKNIFDKLGMKDTTFEPGPEQWDRMVTLFCRDDEGKLYNQEADRRYVFGNYPCGYHAAGAGLASTTDDYIKFALMLYHGGKLPGHRRVIGKKALKQYWEPLAGAGSQRWGMGVRVVCAEGRTLPVGTYGWSGAYGTHFWIDPVNDIVAIYMINQGFEGGAGSASSVEFEKDVMRSLK